MTNPLRQLGKSYTLGQGMITTVLKDLDENIKEGQNRQECSKKLNEFIYQKEWLEKDSKGTFPFNEPFTVKNETIIFDRDYGSQVYLDGMRGFKGGEEMDCYLIEVIGSILKHHNIKKIWMKNIYESFEYEKQEDNKWILITNIK